MQYNAIHKFVGVLDKPLQVQEMLIFDFRRELKRFVIGLQCMAPNLQQHFHCLSLSFLSFVACEYNVHKGACFEAIEECPGTKKKRVSAIDEDLILHFLKYMQSFNV